LRKAGKGAVTLRAKRPRDRDRFRFRCNWAPPSPTTTSTTIVSGSYIDTGLTVIDTCNKLEWEKKETPVGSNGGRGISVRLAVRAPVVLVRVFSLGGEIRLPARRRFRRSRRTLVGSEASADLVSAVEHYRREAGSDVAVRFVERAVGLDIVLTTVTDVMGFLDPTGTATTLHRARPSLESDRGTTGPASELTGRCAMVSTVACARARASGSGSCSGPW
jgi:hypothetical protein